MNADTEEGERRDREDRVADTDGELHNDRAHHVRQDLAGHDVQPVLATELGGLDVVVLALGQHGGTHGARHDWREEETDNQDHSLRARFDARNDRPIVRRSSERQQANERQWQHQEGLDQAPENVVEDPPVVTHQETKHRSRDNTNDGGKRCSNQHISGAEHDARQHVASELVRAEVVAVGKGRLVAEPVRGEGIVWRDVRTKHGTDDPEQNDRQANQRRRALEEQNRFLAARSTFVCNHVHLRAWHGWRCGNLVFDDAHYWSPKRTRGLRIEIRMSPSKVAIM